MKTAEQRIAAMYRMTEEIKRRQERSMLFLLAVCPCILLAVLITVMAGLTHSSSEQNEKVFTAASLLDESAGGYVLAALLAFMAGVIITVVCVKLQSRNTGGGHLAERQKKPDSDPGKKGEKEL